jgi:hypothetical protein
MCLILAIVEVVFSPTPRRSTYGHESQEVSREVTQVRFVAKREQDSIEE